MSKHKFLFKHSLPYTNFTTESNDEPTESTHPTPALPSSVITECQPQQQPVNDYVGSSIIIWNQNRASQPYEITEPEKISVPTNHHFNHVPKDELDEISRISPLQPASAYAGIEDCFSIDSSASILTSLNTNESDGIENFYSFQPFILQHEQPEYSYEPLPFQDDSSTIITSNHHHQDYSSNVIHSNNVEFCTSNAQLVESQPVVLEEQRPSESCIPQSIPSQIISSSTSTSCTTSVIKSIHRVGVITRCPASTDRIISTSSIQSQEIQESKSPSPSPKTVKDEEETVPVNISLLNKNIIIHEGDPKYECKVCQRKFKNKNNFKYHIHDSNDNTVFKYTCKECGKGFIGSTHYKYHLLTHSGERSHKCTECKKDFLTAKKLDRHMLTHSGVKAHQCELCPKAFHHQKELEHHILTHKGLEPFSCKSCSKKFTVRSQLITHESIHTGNEKFPCTVCPKRFVRPKHLQDHLLIHSDEKAFKCEKCNKAFKTRMSLNHHMKTHLDKRPFNCECGRGFVLKKDFIRHRNVHIAIAPFSCPQCEKKFGRKDNLTRHIHLHHTSNGSPQ